MKHLISNARWILLISITIFNACGSLEPVKTEKFKEEKNSTDKVFVATKNTSISGVGLLEAKAGLMDIMINIKTTIPIPTIETIEDQENFETRSKIIIPGTSDMAKAPGHPILPRIPIRIALPQDYEIYDIVLYQNEKIDLQGFYLVQHAGQPVPLSMTDDFPRTTRNKDIYNSNESLPEEIYEIKTIQRLKGVSVAHIMINPVKYVPGSGKISYFESIKLVIKTKPKAMQGENSNNTISSMTDLTMPYQRENIRAISNNINNPEMLVTYSDNNTYMGTYGSICDPAENVEYVAITGQSIIDANTDYTIRDLISYKKSHGLTAKVVSIENIYGIYSGVDNAEKIRNFIKDAYTNWHTKYVLLGGDTNIIPTRKLYCESSAGPDDIPGDLYFQALDGPYNNDGDSRWG